MGDLYFFEGLLSAYCGFNLMTIPVKPVAQRLSHDQFVINNKDFSAHGHLRPQDLMGDSEESLP